MEIYGRLGANPYFVSHFVPRGFFVWVFKVPNFNDFLYSFVFDLANDVVYIVYLFFNWVSSVVRTALDIPTSSH